LLHQANTISLNHTICVVSVIGKSAMGQNSCKANLVDQALKKSVFCELFGDEIKLDPELVRPNIKNRSRSFAFNCVFYYLSTFFLADGNRRLLRLQVKSTLFTLDIIA
jgi:hypothetical protein